MLTGKNHSVATKDTIIDNTDISEEKLLIKLLFRYQKNMQ